MFSRENSARYSPFLFPKSFKQNLLFSLFMSPLMIRTLCSRMCRTRDGRLEKVDGFYLVILKHASNFEQVLEATPHKAPPVRPPTSHHENYQS